MNNSFIRYSTLLVTFLSLLLVTFYTSSCSSKEDDTSEVTENDPYFILSGGDATVFTNSDASFNLPSPNLGGENGHQFVIGNSFFRSNWVAAPASATMRDGLGPVFNSISCRGCHVKDGRGAPPSDLSQPLKTMLIRLSIPGTADNNSPLAEPTYGGQFQNNGILGVDKEGNVQITYSEISGKYPDGTTYSLRKPTYSFINLNYGSMDASVLTSPRTAPFMMGLGLLEAISETTLLEYADKLDSNKDGISGKPNYVWDVIKKKNSIGRFGWKANQPTVKQQTAGAFNGDLGMTTTLFPLQPCTGDQGDCNDAPTGGDPEIIDEILDPVTIYVGGLGVPARRDAEKTQVIIGQKIFREIGCTSCHRETIKTSTNKQFPEFENQTIHPYTDLLLHDMGDGLADNRPDFLANGNEWRTPPLWGIGLIETVNGHTNLLHDGRARNFEEAILWHGGEASAITENFKNLSKENREAVIAFLKSL